jgi:transposase
MAQKGLSMRTVREVLRLRWGLGLSIHKVAQSCKVSPSTVLEYERRAKGAGLSWPLPEGMDDAELEQLLAGGPPAASDRRGLPTRAYLLEEMRKPHVTLMLLWMEYKAVHPDGYQYTQFWRYYQEGKKQLEVALRQEHRAGEKLFSDYSGDSLRLTDPHTGEVRDAPVFVAVLGASNYTYAEAAPDMTLPHWIGAHIRALEYLGGAPQIIVPDNTRTAVLRPDRYEPDVHPAFADMAAHYGTVIIPARVRKPRDKAKVEAGVLVVERWIIAALRKRTFFSLAEMNLALRELLARINGRVCKGFNASRRELFERLDRPALRPLPGTRYEFLEWKSAKVGIDYHISVDKHCYSVPYQLVGQQVEVRLSAGTVEVLYRHRRVASHLRSTKVGGFTTCPEHMPKSHQRYLEWTPSRMVRWAHRTGPQTAALVERLLTAKPHPEMGYRSCLGLIRLGKQYSPARLEAACARALCINALSYRNVKSILQHGLDQAAPPSPQRALPLPEHANLRGRDYYQQEGVPTLC